MAEEDSSRQLIAPAKRRRLQMCFEHGTKSAAKGDFNYATDMFTQCVVGDPGNAIYAKQFLATLARKYNDNKKGAGFTSAPKATALKTSMKKSQYSKDWDSLVKTGVEVLKINPWDVATLMTMGAVCEELQYDEAQLTYLKWALEVNPKEPEINRASGRALAKMGRFDEAIACWHRVKQAKPDDQEAQKAIGDLAVEKTISHGGYEGAESSTEVKADKLAKADFRSEAVAKMTPEQQLERQIAKSPENVSLYIELADLHTREEHHDKAQDVLKRALEASGGEISIRERLEDSQLRSGRLQVKIAEKRAANEKTPESLKLLQDIKAKFNSTEMDYYRARSERYPNDLGLKFELGLRLKRAGQFVEAINSLQGASGDPKRKAQIHLELGECFQQIKQFKLATSNYEESLASAGPREVDLRKLGLYRAGKLTLALAEKHLAAQDAQGKQELDRAEKHLSELAGLEFGYRDVPQLLDKISKIRDKE